MTNRAPRRILPAIELHFTSPDAQRKAHDRFGGPQGLLRGAAVCLVASRSHHHGAGAAESVHYEGAALREFLTSTGLWLHQAAVEECLTAYAMRGGREHRVALLQSENRVLKSADACALATESAFDYLTDLLLPNYFFDDDIRPYLESLRCFVAPTGHDIPVWGNPQEWPPQLSAEP